MKRSTMTPERLLTVAETSQQLNLSEKSIYRLIKAQSLPVIRCGRAIRITPEDLKNYTNSRRQYGA